MSNPFISSLKTRNIQLYGNIDEPKKTGTRKAPATTITAGEFWKNEPATSFKYINAPEGALTL